MRDFYEVLNVSKEANSSELKKAYRALAMKYHPDRNAGDATAEDKFKEASNAYKVLSDADQRARYDQFGHAGIGRGGGGGYEGFQGTDDIFSAFGDLFGDFFGGGRARGPRRGGDVQVETSLSFAEAVHGCQKDVTFARNISCDDCSGSGAASGTQPTTCGQCKGSGQVVHSQGFFMVQATCPGCKGQGRVIKNKCKACKGVGTQAEESSISVSVPAGVDRGQVLRLAGKGEAGPGGAGHLYVVLNIAEDERFVREGANVLVEVKISYLQACLGASIEVPTLEDHCEGTQKLDIEAGTQPGTAVIRRGEGIAVAGGRGKGDFVYQFLVDIPTKLSVKERELLLELAQESDVVVEQSKPGLFSRRKRS